MAICYEQADLCSRALYTVYSFDEAVTGYRKVTWFIGVFCKHTRNQPVKKLIACPITASLCLRGNVSTRFLKVLQDMCVRIPSAEIPVGVVYLLLTGRFLAFMGQVLAGPRVWCLKASAFFSLSSRFFAMRGDRPFYALIIAEIPCFSGCFRIQIRF